MKTTSGRTTGLLLAAIVRPLTVLAVTPYTAPSQIVRAEARIDQVTILSTKLNSQRPPGQQQRRRHGVLA